MKLRKGFILRDVAGKTFVVATGELSREFQGMITLNETGKFIWECLADDTTAEEIVEKMAKVYDEVEKDILERDVTAFINKMIEEKIVE